MLMGLVLALAAATANAQPPKVDLDEDKITFVDLDNDGRDEIIVERVSYGFENGDRSRGHALRIYRQEDDGHPTPIATYADGAGGWGEFQNWKLDNAINTVAVTVSGSARRCCDDYYRTYFFKLEGNRMVSAAPAITKPAKEDLNDDDITDGLENLREATINIVDTTYNHGQLQMNVRTGTYVFFRAKKGQSFSASFDVTAGAGSLQLVDAKGRDLAPNATAHSVSATLPSDGIYVLGIFNVVDTEWELGWVEQPVVGTVQLRLKE